MFKCLIILFALFQGFSVLAQAVSCEFEHLSSQVKDKGRGAKSIGGVAITAGTALLALPDPTAATKKKAVVLIVGGTALTTFGSHLGNKSQGYMQNAHQIAGGNLSGCRESSPNRSLSSTCHDLDSGVCKCSGFVREGSKCVASCDTNPYQDRCTANLSCEAMPEQPKCMEHCYQPDSSGICKCPGFVNEGGRCEPSCETDPSQNKCENYCYHLTPEGDCSCSGFKKEGNKCTQTCQADPSQNKCENYCYYADPSGNCKCAGFIKQNGRCVPSCEMDPNQERCLAVSTKCQENPNLVSCRYETRTPASLASERGLSNDLQSERAVTKTLEDFCSKNPNVLRCTNNPDGSLVVHDSEGNKVYPFSEEAFNRLSPQDKSFLEQEINSIGQKATSFGLASSGEKREGSLTLGSEIFGSKRGLSTLTSGGGSQNSFKSRKPKKPRNFKKSFEREPASRPNRYSKAFQDVLNEEDSSVSHKPSQYGKELIGNSEDNIFEQVSRSYKKLGENMGDLE